MKNQCCNKKLELKKNENPEYVYFYCKTCERAGRGKNEQEAWREFLKSKPQAAQQTQVPALPTKPEDLRAWVQYNMPEVRRACATFLKDETAIVRMIERSISYVARNKQLEKCWESEENIEILIDEIKDAFWYGAVLGETGSIVAFDGKAKFIPSKECFDFALTNGEQAPLEWIKVFDLCKNDIGGAKHINDQFEVEIEPGRPRGELQQIIVQCKHKIQGKIGKTFDKDRLMEKAKSFANCKNYIKNITEFNEAKSEGKTKFKGDREYYIKPINTKNGLWNKEIFLDEITCTYIGGNQTEQLIKLCLKSFLWPLMKERNLAECCNSKWSDAPIEKTRMETVNNIAKAAKAQFETETEIQEAEYEVIEKEEHENKKNNGELFDKNDII